MQAVRSGSLPYTKLDVLHRRTLQNILPQFGLRDLKEIDLDRLTLAWHQLDTWPDVQAGLSRLRQRYLIAPVSNGNTSLLCDLARRNDLRWDAILGADYARAFKPMKEVYLAAADAFNLLPGQCLMCAAHGSDLNAAAANGLRTAYIARPLERPVFSESAALTSADLSAVSLMDLAVQLGA
jgi:2-haloacid dehalogenase